MIRSKRTLVLCLVSQNIFLLVFVFRRFNLNFDLCCLSFYFFFPMLLRYMFDMKLAYIKR